MRCGDYKLIEFYEDGRLELYNLKHDIGETRDLKSKLPDKAAELSKKLDAWLAETKADMPVTNPEYKPR